MAEPITTDYFRAQMVFKHPSGLPRDIFVNTFAFRNEVPGEPRSSVAQDIVAALTSLYSEAVSTFGSISSWMPANVLVNPEVRVYDLGQAPPRDPIITTLDTTSWAKGTEANSLPFEVASCISWRTNINRSWGRGRTFIGPLTKAACVQDNGVPRLHANFVSCLVGAADRFLTGVQVRPAIMGKLGPNLITGGWVDNEFDTQRRRGIAASLRTEFAA